MKLALGVEYDGNGFHGFQRQRNAASVQEALETALSRIAAAPIRIAAAGRTDRGVHATGQVIGFTSPTARPLAAWRRGTNALTPPAVKVLWAHEVDDAFHPRYSAVARRYQFLYHESDIPSPLLRGFALQSQPLDDEAMHRAAQALVGEHDFSTFRGAGCQSRSAQRCVHRISVQRSRSLVVLDITANAFLLHMVRNIAGALHDVGLGGRPEQWIADALAQRSRSVAGRTARPEGLYLVGVRYPGYAFPEPPAPALLRAVGGLDRF